MEHPVDVTDVMAQDINSEYPDYAPTINENETLMVFTSRRPGDNSNDRVAVDHEYYEEIFITGKAMSFTARNYVKRLNTGYHNASVNLSPDGTEHDRIPRYKWSDLLLSSRNSDETSGQRQTLDGINSEYLESSATITEDDKTIFFTSNRPGGYGGTDIYSCTLGKGGRWTNVTNLGPLVNTEMDEEGVFISANGQHLYFSSNGLAGMGDLDIYRSTYDAAKKQWGEPVNLGYPINSVENDIYFVLTKDEKFAYISSLRRENVGEQDIYKVDMQNWKPVYLDRPEYSEVFADPSIVKTGTPVTTNLPNNVTTNVTNAPSVVVSSEPKSMSLSWKVFDELDKRALEADVQLVDAAGKRVNVTRSGAGSYTTTISLKPDSTAIYKINISATEFIPFMGSLYLHGAGRDIVDEIGLKRAPASTTPLANVGYVMNVYFSHDGVDPLSYEGIRNLLQMMKNSPTMKVEISGHTDSQGPDAYNENLSLRRAQAVRNILIKGGADGARITAVGYGESKPMETNDTMEGRRMNRRIEFRILE